MSTTLSTVRIMRILRRLLKGSLVQMENSMVLWGQGGKGGFGIPKTPVIRRTLLRS